MLLYVASLLLLGITSANCDNFGHHFGGGNHGGFFPYGGSYGAHGGDSDGTCLLPIMDGLIVTPMKREYKDGEKIEISCEEGFELTASSETTCRVFDVFGRYGIFMPSITPATCRELPSCRAPDGPGVILSPEKSRYAIGENVTVTCEEGFEQIGESFHTCEKTRLYGYYESGTFGVRARHLCREIRDCRPPMQSGLNIQPFKMRYSPGEEIVLSCDDDYELTVINVSVCQKSGQFDFERKSDDDSQYVNWDEENFIFSTSVCKKKAKCTAPEFPGLIVSPMKEEYMTGDEITLSCQEGYELTRPNKSVCGYQEDGNDDYSFIFGFMDRMNGYGQFTPKVRSRTCMVKPTCLAPRSRGVIVTPEKDSYDEGESVEISCDDGFELIGNSTTSTCTRVAQDWGFFYSRFSPDTRDICRKKKSCKAVSSEGMILTPEKTAYDIGEVVAVSCAPGYTLNAANQSVCEERRDRGDYRSKNYGKFSPDLYGEICERIPSCDKPVSEGLIITPDKSYYEIGDKISISCEEGYEQRVAPSSICMRIGERTRGEFDPELGREPCKRPITCEPPTDENLVISPIKEVYSEGDVISVSCKEGYTQLVAETMTCERSRHCRNANARISGCFHPQSNIKKSCIETPKCGPIDQPNLSTSPAKDSYDSGDVVTLECDEGYSLVSEVYEQLTCEQSTRMFGFGIVGFSIGFRPRLPGRVCQKRRTCDAPPSQLGLILTPQKDTYYVDETVQLSCEEGYELTQMNSSTCVMRIRESRFFFNVVRERRMVFRPSIEKSGVCRKLEVEEREMEEEETLEVETEEPPVETEAPETTEPPTDAPDTTEPTPPPTTEQTPPEPDTLELVDENESMEEEEEEEASEYPAGDMKTTEAPK